MQWQEDYLKESKINFTNNTFTQHKCNKVHAFYIKITNDTDSQQTCIHHVNVSCKQIVNNT